MDSSIREAVFSALKESKDLEKERRYSDALEPLEKVSHLAPTLSVGWKIICKIGNLCHKFGQSPHHMRKAEQTLASWRSNCKRQGVPLNTPIIHIYALTLNNWAVYHQSQTDYHKAINYLMRATKLLDNYPSNEMNILSICAKTRHNLSSLYVELRRFKEAIFQGEMGLVYLQKEFKNREMLGMKSSDEMICAYTGIFYNIGVSEGALGNIDQMIEAYKNGLEISKDRLPNNHPLVGKIKEASSSYSVPSRRDSLNKKLRDKYINNLHGESPTQAKSGPKDTAKNKLKAKDKTRLAHSNNNSIPKTIHKKSSSLSVPSKTQSLALPKRYYSKEKLEILNRQMKETNHIKFISADQFFYKKIKDLLGLDKNLSSLKSDKEYLEIQKKDNEERRSINDLRLRKHCKQVKGDTSRGKEFVKERIEALKEEEEANKKRGEIYIRSQKNIRSYRKLSNRDEFKGKGLARSKTIVPDNFEVAKEEILGLMDSISEELKGAKRRENKRRSTCVLAVSARKNYNREDFRHRAVLDFMQRAMKVTL